MKRLKLIKLAAVIMVITLALTGCMGQDDKKEDENSGASKSSYKEITQDEAMKMMKKEKGFVIVDVRTEAEYNEGYIEGAINIPIETITDKLPTELKDKKQKIFVYCRFGNRSKAAADKLAKMGYSNIYEMGGIQTWKGKIVKK